MVLFTVMPASAYARSRMPQPKTGTGPWGDAIRYWLRQRDMRQADLVREVRKANPGEAITANTLSNAARGLHCSTRTLEQIARALEIPLDDVLVSPDRQSAQDMRRKMVQEITENVMRAVDATRATPPPRTIDQETDAYAERLNSEQEQLNRVRRLSQKAQHKPSKVRKRRQK